MHPVVVLGAVLLPVGKVVDERPAAFLRYFAHDLHVGLEVRFAVGRGAGQDGTGGLQHRDCAEFGHLIAELLQVGAEFVLRDPARRTAIVHADHQEHHLRRELADAPIEAIEQRAGVVAVVGGFDNDIARARQFGADALFKDFAIIACAQGVIGPVGDAVAVENPFDRVG